MGQSEIAALRAEVARLRQRVASRTAAHIMPSLRSRFVAEAYISFVVQGGQTLLGGGPVYGIKRKSGESLFVTTDKPAVVRARATATISSGAVSAVTITTQGEGYTGSPPAVTVGPPPGGGTQAVITATLADRFVKYAYLTACGSGYDEGATVAFSAPPSGTTATGTATVRDGKVVAITITNQGSGYTSAPSVTITPVSAGSGAAATAVRGIGGITLSITTAGTGYTSAPSVSIAAPTALPSSTAYPDGLGLAQVLSGPLYGPSLPSPDVGSQILVVHDDRSLVAYGLMGDGPSVPFSRPPDAVASWYQTLVKINGADADADGVLPAWVPMFGGL